MRNDRLDAKATAKINVRGQWAALYFTAFLIGLIAALPETAASVIARIFIALSPLSGVTAASMGIAFAIISIISAVFSIPLRAAVDKKYLLVARGGDRRDSSVFEYYRAHDWTEKIKAYLVSGIFIALGTLLCVIPGIILSIRYSMLGFVFADNPNISYREAMDRSKEITDGRKWELFVMYLSFIGWHLLAVITCGILEIWVVPYENTAFAAWYDLNRPVEDDFASGETDELFQSGTSDFYENTNTLF